MFVCVCVVLCLDRGLATSWSPIQGVLSPVNYKETEQSALCSNMGASSRVRDQRQKRTAKLRPHSTYTFKWWALTSYKKCYLNKLKCISGKASEISGDFCSLAHVAGLSKLEYMKIMVMIQFCQTRYNVLHIRDFYLCTNGLNQRFTHQEIHIYWRLDCDGVQNQLPGFRMMFKEFFCDVLHFNF
jgi:hypothetical protein